MFVSRSDRLAQQRRCPLLGKDPFVVLSASSRPALALAASTLAIGLLSASSAPAQQAGPQPQTVTAVGTGEVRPQPSDRNDNDAIRRAVAAARRAVVPVAVSSARARAVQIGSATGLRVGGILSVSEASSNLFFGPFDPSSGTFGPGRFCGQVPRFRTVRAPSGRVVRRLRIGSRRMCRVPPRVFVSLTVTYAASPAA